MTAMFASVQTADEEALEAAIKQKADNIQSRNAEDAAFEGCVTDDLSSTMAELLTNSKQTTQHRRDMLQQDYETLNTDQRRIVDNITEAVSSNTPIHLVISGQSGSGKPVSLIGTASRCCCPNMLSSIQCWRHYTAPHAVTAS